MEKDIIINLINKAKEAKHFAYAPYSGFSVGAALLTASNKIYTGCNVENAAFGAGICAERTAVSKAVSEGEKAFIAIAVIAKGDDFCTPCGICRQVLSEFSHDMNIICCNESGEFKILTIDELLPFSFNKEFLK